MITEDTAKNIIKGITDKIEATTDIDEWAEFWRFTREDYEEFLELPIKALKQNPKKGKWIGYNHRQWFRCNRCGHVQGIESNYCPNCGAKMECEE